MDAIGGISAVADRPHDQRRAAHDVAGGEHAVEVGGELAVLGAINTMRILGIFSRLTSRDNKPRYLAFMPRMWGHLGRTLEHPSLADARAFVNDVARPYLEKAA